MKKKYTQLTVIFLIIVNCLMSINSYAQVIAGGDTHSLSLCIDSTVRSWGESTSGSLGTNGGPNQNTPVQVHGPGNVGFLTGVVAIAAGAGGQSRALKSDSTVWDWGSHVGDGSGFDRLVPVHVTSLSGITSISSGNAHTIALKSDGTVWTWGANNHGELGDGSTNDNDNPQQVVGLSGIKAISGGGFHTLVLKSDSTVWDWGENYYGELGDGTTNTTGCYCIPSPVHVNGLTGVIAIAGGGIESSLALKSDGTVWAWGANYYGQLGNGSIINSLIPVQVIGLTGITAIAYGHKHCLALKNDGTVWAWGVNGYGQCGDGTTYYERHSPVQVSGLTGIYAISAGGDHSLALKNDGTVWTWGLNAFGELGNGTTGSTGCNCDSTAGQVSGLCIVAVGVNEIQKQNTISVFPNPASDKITIQVSETVKGEINVEIIDIFGRIIFSQTEIKNQKSEINISNFKPGVYFLHAKLESGDFVKNFIKE